jgi:hypothetical protein
MNTGSKLLTEKTSEFYKLYEQHGAQRLANKFHANKALDKSFLNKVAGKMKLVAGAAAGIITQVGSGSKTVGAVAGIATCVVAVGVGSAYKKSEMDLKH